MVMSEFLPAKKHVIMFGFSDTRTCREEGFLLNNHQIYGDLRQKCLMDPKFATLISNTPLLPQLWKT